jgi:hypothetical protein
MLESSFVWSTRRVISFITGLTFKQLDLPPMRSLTGNSSEIRTVQKEICIALQRFIDVYEEIV